MADNTYATWKGLVNAANRQIPDILEKYVAPKAEEILTQRIQKDVYNAYSPIRYNRRFVLRDTPPTSTMTGKYTLLVTSNADGGPSWVTKQAWHHSHAGSLLDLIENGPYGLWTKGFPRPVIQNTVSEFDDGKLDVVIRRGIRETLET